MTNFKAFWVEKTDDGVAHSVIERSTDDLPEGELLVKVAYSSLNYKCVCVVCVCGVSGV